MYNGTKAWLHMFSMNLRTQLEQAGSKIKVVEIAPPQVETIFIVIDRSRRQQEELGREGHVVEEFMEDVRKAWEANADMIAPGMGGKIVGQWDEDPRVKVQGHGEVGVSASVAARITCR